MLKSCFLIYINKGDFCDCSIGYNAKYIFMSSSSTNTILSLVCKRLIDQRRE